MEDMPYRFNPLEKTTLGLYDLYADAYDDDGDNDLYVDDDNNVVDVESQRRPRRC